MNNNVRDTTNFELFAEMTNLYPELPKARPFPQRNGRTLYPLNYDLEIENNPEAQHYLSENGFHIETAEKLHKHSHALQRFLSSFMSFKALSDMSLRGSGNTISHADRFHFTSRMNIPNLEMRRYLYSKEDPAYIRKHGAQAFPVCKNSKISLQ